MRAGMTQERPKPVWVPRPRDPNAARERLVRRWLAACRDPALHDKLPPRAQFWVTRAALTLAIIAAMLLLALILWIVGPAPHM